jgi:phenylpropionate dioxygenase-like ring-hydroxylating dioxygenase large terminal subunit
MVVVFQDRERKDRPEISIAREMIPATGLREYWYPAFPATKLGKRKPRGIRLLGEDIVFFRDEKGKVVALRDLCAHRGGKLSGGICHFPGTVSCPYHGWTYNADGQCVAALVEGPQSHIPKTAVQIPVKQVREFRQIVWVWIGDGDPVPLEEDVPEEFLDPRVTVFTEIRTWPVNWRPLIENAIDGHAPYVHRNSVLAVLFGLGPLGRKLTPISTREGKGIALSKETNPPMEQEYPSLGRFPRRYIRKYWIWIFQKKRTEKTFTGKPYTQEILLPGVTRISYPNHLYIRWGVPIDESLVRNFYWHVIRGSRAWKVWFAICYYLFRRWAMNRNFSEQDRAIVGQQNYTSEEKLSHTDAVVIQWRKLVLQGYHAGRRCRIRLAPKEEQPNL